MPDTRVNSVATTTTLHHVGYAVGSISAMADAFAKSLGAAWDGNIVHDPLQEACVAFFHVGGQHVPAIELIQPAGDGSPLHKFVAKGGGLHHLCYEVDSLDGQLAESRAARCLIVKQPLPAVAFGGRRIAWVYTPQKLLVEYLER